MHTFHLPLSSALHKALRAEAEDQDRPATEILRQALEAWLAVRRRERLTADIAAYAESMAGTHADLDPDLEKAGIEDLLADDEAGS